MFKHHLILGTVRQEHFSGVGGGGGGGGVGGEWFLPAAGHTLMLCKGGCRSGAIGLVSFCNDEGRIGLRMNPRSREERPREIGKGGGVMWVEWRPQIHDHLEPQKVGSLQV